jgi:hypothetical protein
MISSRVFLYLISNVCVFCGNFGKLVSEPSVDDWSCRKEAIEKFLFQFFGDMLRTK